MRLKSETVMTIKFIEATRSSLNEGDSVFEICKRENLNYDLVARNLIKLHKAGVILREKRGPNTRYEFPLNIKLGVLISNIQPIDLVDSDMNTSVIETLNSRAI